MKRTHPGILVWICFLSFAAAHAQDAAPPLPAAATPAPSPLAGEKERSELTHLTGNRSLLTVYQQAGVFDLFLGDRQLSNARITVNGISLLPGANIHKKKSRIIIRNRFGDLNVTASLRTLDSDWLGIDLSVKNRGKAPLSIGSIHFIQSELEGLFSEAGAAKLHFHSHAEGAPRAPGGSRPVGQKPLLGYGVGSLWTEEGADAWTLAALPGPLWPLQITVDGKAGILHAGLERPKHPLVVAPGQALELGECLISGSLTPLNALLALGKMMTPHRKLSPASLHGYLLTQEVAPQLRCSTVTEAAALLTDWGEGAAHITTFTLGEGWESGLGDWSFRADFSDQKHTWVRQLTRMQAIPGLTLAPFRLPPGPLPIGVHSLAPLPQKPPACLLADPRDEALNLQLTSQLRDLTQAGVTCFRTRGLTPDLPTWPADVPPPNPFLRPVYQKLRRALGKKSLWISDERALAATAGRVDILQLALGAPRNWETVREKIVRPYANWFWLHNNAWTLCQAGLRLTGTTLDGAAGKGFNMDEARSWCTYLILTGGPIIWRDTPSSLPPELRDLILRTLQHAGGKAGLPLDYLSTPLPERWIRREGKRTYIGFFNWSDAEKAVTLSGREFPTLAKRRVVKDLFTDEVHRIDLGTLTVTLRPHQSFCTVID
jgi:hypothetical protein